MSDPPILLEVEASVREAAKRMWANQEGSILVLADDKVTGILTERDLTWVLAEGRDPERTSLDAVMSSPVVTIEPAEEIETAIETMIDEQVRHLVVALEGDIRGVLSVTDIAHAEPELARRAHENVRTRWEG